MTHNKLKHNHYSIKIIILLLTRKSDNLTNKDSNKKGDRLQGCDDTQKNQEDRRKVLK